MGWWGGVCSGVRWDGWDLWVVLVCTHGWMDYCGGGFGEVWFSSDVQWFKVWAFEIAEMYREKGVGYGAYKVIARKA